MRIQGFGRAEEGDIQTLHQNPHQLLIVDDDVLSSRCG